MARTKTRTINAATVTWHKGPRAGTDELISYAEVKDSPAPFALDCWICGDRVAKGMGHTVKVATPSYGAGFVSAVHAGGCETEARTRAAEINGGFTPAPEPAAEPEPTPDPAPTPTNTDPAAAAVAALRSLIDAGNAPVDEGQVRSIVADEIAKVVKDHRPKVTVTLPDGTLKAELPDSAHAMADEALSVLSALQVVWLVGPTGTGKTHLARALADALGARYFEQACFGASESALIGTMTATGDYIATPVVEAVDYTREDGSKGSVLCLDEFDGCDESAALALNSLLNGDHLATPRRNGMTRTERGAAPLYIVITSNTDGTSYGTREYNARTKLDDATRSRVELARVWVDYDKGVEQAYVDAYSLPQAVADTLWGMREKIAAHGLEGRHISTRAFRQLGMLYAAHPDRWNPDELVAKVTATWTPDERIKVGA